MRGTERLWTENREPLGPQDQDEVHRKPEWLLRGPNWNSSDATVSRNYGCGGYLPKMIAKSSLLGCYGLPGLAQHSRRAGVLVYHLRAMSSSYVEIPPSPWAPNPGLGPFQRELELLVEIGHLGNMPLVKMIGRKRTIKFDHSLSWCSLWTTIHYSGSSVNIMEPLFSQWSTSSFVRCSCSFHVMWAPPYPSNAPGPKIFWMMVISAVYLEVNLIGCYKPCSTSDNGIQHSSNSGIGQPMLAACQPLLVTGRANLKIRKHGFGVTGYHDSMTYDVVKSCEHRGTLECWSNQWRLQCK